MSAMLQLLTGSGLAASAGMNAYIPLLTVGLLARFTGLVTLPPGWDWLSNGWVLAVLAVLLAVELVADKIPAVDSANDVLQTAVRPTSGGLVFGAGSSADTLTVDPTVLFDDRGWPPIVAGAVLALVVHALKALARPVLNSMTACLAAPVASTVEDLTSATMSLVALLVPILVIGFLLWLLLAGWWLWRRRRQRRRRPPGRSRTRATRHAGRAAAGGDEAE